MRLIDADELIRMIRGKKIASATTKVMMLDAVEECPTVDAASIVRCKDCKNWDSSTEGRYVGGWCFCEKLQFSTSPDWFCADGVRKDDGDAR